MLPKKVTMIDITERMSLKVSCPLCGAEPLQPCTDSPHHPISSCVNRRHVLRALAYAKLGIRLGKVEVNDDVLALINALL